MSSNSLTEYDLATRHDLEDLFDSFRECFHDKETEQNWTKRDAAIGKLRRVTIGNSPTDFKDTYLAGIKSLLEGIIKAINSLVCLYFLDSSHLPSCFPSACVSCILSVHCASHSVAMLVIMSPILSPQRHVVVVMHYPFMFPSCYHASYRHIKSTTLFLSFPSFSFLPYAVHYSISPSIVLSCPCGSLC